MSLSRIGVVILFALGIVVSPSVAQSQSQAAKTPQASATPAAPAAKPADVASPDAIIAAVYNVICGPAGAPRDWDRFRGFFVPGGRLIPSGPNKEGTGFNVHVMTPDEFATAGAAYFEKNGFYESEIARRTERYGNILQAFSTYESRHDAKDATPFARGINSFQLFYDGTRWWVVTIYWQQESPEFPVPKEFLPAAH